MEGPTEGLGEGAETDGPARPRRQLPIEASLHLVSLAPLLASSSPHGGARTSGSSTSIDDGGGWFGDGGGRHDASMPLDRYHQDAPAWQRRRLPRRDVLPTRPPRPPISASRTSRSWWAVRQPPHPAVFTLLSPFRSGAWEKRPARGLVMHLGLPPSVGDTRSFAWALHLLCARQTKECLSHFASSCWSQPN
jgi:hypothetical protein